MMRVQVCITLDWDDATEDSPDSWDWPTLLDVDVDRVHEVMVMEPPETD